jgi:transposase
VAALSVADGAYAGQKLHDALVKFGERTVEIVKRTDQAASFEVLPRRWVVASVERAADRMPTATNDRESQSNCCHKILPGFFKFVRFV